MTPKERQALLRKLRKMRLMAKELQEQINDLERVANAATTSTGTRSPGAKRHAKWRATHNSPEDRKRHADRMRVWREKREEKEALERQRLAEEIWRDGGPENE